tara:strand:- start:232 stop:531 length:300 start_codon:yes stop_codon:yes gene_type:complete
MASKQIIWTDRAKAEFYHILEFYIDRNKSTTFSEKLLSEVEELTFLLKSNEFIGRLTSDNTVRVFPVRHFLLFYAIRKESIYIVSFWDNRQNDTKKSYK